MNLEIKDGTTIPDNHTNAKKLNDYFTTLFTKEDTTVKPLLKDTPNKGHKTFNLSIKDKFYGPYRTMAIQFYP